MAPSTHLLRVVVLAGAALTGCVAGEHGVAIEDQRVGQVIQPIIHGVPSGAEHDAVVVLTTFEGGTRQSLCSATVVAPNLLVTARHCVSNTDPTTACAPDGSPVSGSLIKGNRDPKTLVVFVGTNGVAPDTAVESNGVARGSKIVIDSATTVCNHDVAFVLLDAQLDVPVAPMRLGPPRVGETVTAVGWGIDETGNLPRSRGARGDLALVGLGPAAYPDNPSWGYGDAEFMLGESACAGDSGGPVFASTGALVGIASRAGNGDTRSTDNMASNCIGAASHAVYTHLGKLAPLAALAFKSAGATMLEEDTSVATAEPAGSGAASSGADGAKDAGLTATKKSAEVPGILPADGAAAASDAGGCSMSTEPQHGSVEYAAGLVALLATLLGLHRRLRSRPEDQGPRPSMHSIP